MTQVTRALSLLGVLAVFAWTVPVHAGGYDTPMLYSARHMGMGGTAVGYVHDASALFHNPAGLAHTQRASVLGDFSLLLGTLKGSPADYPEAVSDTSEPTFAPFFLVGGAVRLTDWLTVGAALYPVASAGATYEYDDESGNRIEDHTQLVFVEASPGVAVNLPYNVNIGLGYRITWTSLDRTTGVAGGDKSLDLNPTGWNFASFRAGIQWQPIGDPAEAQALERRSLQLGMSYRHKTNIDLEQDESLLRNIPVKDAAITFTLPSRLSFGVRGDLDAFGAAVDLEYGFNGQNDEQVLTSDLGLDFQNILEWSNAITLRTGVEYRFALPRGRIAARLGYVLDDKTSNESYPTAFGTPPAPTHVLTAGAGYDGGPWEVNLAYAYRFGSTEVTEEDIPDATACTFCGLAGDYEMNIHGIYADFSYDFE